MKHLFVRRWSRLCAAMLLMIAVCLGQAAPAKKAAGWPAG